MGAVWSRSTEFQQDFQAASRASSCCSGPRRPRAWAGCVRADESAALPSRASRIEPGLLLLDRNLELLLHCPPVNPQTAGWASRPGPTLEGSDCDFLHQQLMARAWASHRNVAISSRSSDTPGGLEHVDGLAGCQSGYVG